MRDIPREEWPAVRALLPAPGAAGHMAFVYSVLDGSAPGGVLGGDGPATGWAVVCNASGFFHAFGVAPTVAGPVIERLRSDYVGDEPTSVWASNETWEKAFAATGEPIEWRTEFHAPDAPPLPPPLAPGLVTRRLGADSLGTFGDGLDPWVIRAWGGVERFLELAMPFGVIEGSTLLSFCCACAVGGPAGEAEAEVEVGTVPGARERGLATAAAAAFMSHCAERGMVAAWTCTSSNVASGRLAERLGFRPFRRVAGIRLS